MIAFICIIYIRHVYFFSCIFYWKLRRLPKTHTKHAAFNYIYCLFAKFFIFEKKKKNINRCAIWKWKARASPARLMLITWLIAKLWHGNYGEMEKRHFQDNSMQFVLQPLKAVRLKRDKGYFLHSTIIEQVLIINSITTSLKFCSLMFKDQFNLATLSKVSRAQPRRLARLVSSSLF